MNTTMPSDGGFLAEGLSVYYDASIVLREFRKRVHEVCIQALQQAREKLAKVGVEWGRDEPLRSAYPDHLEGEAWDNEWAVLCAGVSIRGFGMFSVGVYWYRASDGTMAANSYGGLALNSARAREHVWRALSGASGPRVERDADHNEVYIFKRIEPADTPDLTQALADVVDSWVGLLTKAGGVKALRKGLPK